MVSFEIFVKAMPPSLSELKVTPSFCFAFKIPDDRAVTSKYYIEIIDYLDFPFVISFETCEHDLSLTGFKSVHNTGNRPFVIAIRKENKLFINEVGIGYRAGIFFVQIDFGKSQFFAPEI